MEEIAVRLVTGSLEWFNIMIPIAAIVASALISYFSIRENRQVLQANLIHNEKMRAIEEKHAVYNEVISGLMDAVYSHYTNMDSFRATYAALDAKMLIYAPETVYAEMASLRNVTLKYMKMMDKLRNVGREWDELSLEEEKTSQIFNDKIVAFTSKITDDVAHDRSSYSGS